jgi:thiol-disulfide isomerase/thioredoxin
MKSICHVLFLLVLINKVLLKKDGELYDAGRSTLINLNPMNFDTQITNNRNKEIISFIHFYSPDDGKSNQLKDVFIELDKEYSGMFKLAGLNCKKYKDLCSKQGVTDYPTYKIYPPLPAPPMKYEGKIEPKYIISYLGRFIGNKVQELNNNNFDEFINGRSNIPKVLLFTNKKNIPLIFKRLSLQFDQKIDFGIVRSEDTGITSRYKVKSFPKIMAIGTDKKTKFYEGEMRYKLIMDFCNVYQETFFRVGEESTPNEEPKKPWMTEKFPEYTKESAGTLCFNVDGALCVLVIHKEKPNDKIQNIISSIQNWLSPKISRGIKYKFGWINSSTQNGMMTALGLKKADGPKLVLINRGSRKRFHLFDGEITEENLQKVFDSLASGDLRFKAFKGNKLPELDE